MELRNRNIDPRVGYFLGGVGFALFAVLAIALSGCAPESPDFGDEPQCEPLDVCALPEAVECCPDCEDCTPLVEESYLHGWNDGRFEGWRDGVASVECAPIATCECLGMFEPFADFIGCALIEDGNCVSLCGASTFFDGNGELYNCEAPHEGVPQ